MAKKGPSICIHPVHSLWRKEHPGLFLTCPGLQLPERQGKVIINSSYQKDAQIVTKAVSDSYTRLHCKLAGSSRGIDPEAIEDGSAKVPLCEQRQSNRLMGCMIAEKGSENDAAAAVMVLHKSEAHLCPVCLIHFWSHPFQGVLKSREGSEGRN